MQFLDSRGGKKDGDGRAKEVDQEGKSGKDCKFGTEWSDLYRPKKECILRTEKESFQPVQQDLREKQREKT